MMYMVKLLIHPKVDLKNNYRSHRIVDEMLEILARVIEEPLMEDIKSSQTISLEIDETTDVSVNRQLDIHIRFEYGSC